MVTCKSRHCSASARVAKWSNFELLHTSLPSLHHTRRRSATGKTDVLSLAEVRVEGILASKAPATTKSQGRSQAELPAFGGCPDGRAVLRKVSSGSCMWHTGARIQAGSAMLVASCTQSLAYTKPCLPPLQHNELRAKHGWVSTGLCFATPSWSPLTFRAPPTSTQDSLSHSD